MDLPTRILLFYVVLVVSLVVHEAAHALFAKLGGDLTAYRGGQVTLNPIPHMRREPMGTIVLPLVLLIMSGGTMCMGFAHAPFDPNWAWRHPKRAALMSAAGPLSNVLLAVIAFIVLKALILTGEAATLPGKYDAGQLFGEHLMMVVADGGAVDGAIPALIKIASVFLFLNVLLALLNLLPIPPFDGSGVVEGLLTKVRPFFDVVRSNPLGLVIGLVVAWSLLNEWFWPVMSFVYRLL